MHNKSCPAIVTGKPSKAGALSVRATASFPVAVLGACFQFTGFASEALSARAGSIGIVACAAASAHWSSGAQRNLAVVAFESFVAHARSVKACTVPGAAAGAGAPVTIFSKAVNPPCVTGTDTIGAVTEAVATAPVAGAGSAWTSQLRAVGAEIFFCARAFSGLEIASTMFGTCAPVRAFFFLARLARKALFTLAHVLHRQGAII